MDNVKYRDLIKVRPSKPDSRDYRYQQKKISLKPEVDLREFDSLVEDQGELGSCVGNATTNSYELMTKQSYPDKFVELSRLYVYYNARMIEGTINEDMGVYEIRNALKGVKEYGICKEELWPYDPNKVNVKPSDECYVEGKPRTITSYTSLSTITEMLEVLNLGKPIVIGMDVYLSFMYVDKNTPVVSMPNNGDAYIGGHSVNIVGYSIEKSWFIAKNSFGSDWGDNGYCYIPFTYVDRYVFEKWIFDIIDPNIIKPIMLVDGALGENQTH